MPIPFTKYTFKYYAILLQFIQHNMNFLVVPQTFLHYLVKRTKMIKDVKKEILELLAHGSSQQHPNFLRNIFHELSLRLKFARQYSMMFMDHFI